ncbi:ABC transporter ATP-binding protein [Dendronalium sp. ChiSLP03b]|uniref:ABC transporter ATP-binding protein n=1 Tax=Dendronalium sp. ChiSLP03b TaxID=3075381 RepID=UPI002AD5179E|nr:ABC transporter ATP-binding protein [Dendronalium sp. ChiSLP03b]MDZ8202859.1 ABC transporter ATP-binding protein [Dendronalium sp. ChiSLP03b]
MISINEQDLTLKPQDNESDIVLSVNGVSKKFCRDLKRSLMYGVQDMSSELLGLRGKSDKLRPKEFWALDNVSFQLRRGESLGLVGKNGSGKSTLLRIIAGLIKPDTGFVEVNGRVAPLIALGAGFNPILTGRENIYANMSILGLSKKEIDERFDEVIDFAEIGDAIDAPVQTYSSGMAARLGFASAIHTEPEILLIDEVLAVGDIKFRAKCYCKLDELRQKGTSFVLVSHQPQAILTVCNSAIYLLKGQLIESGDTYSIMNRYEEDLFGNNGKKELGKITLPEKPRHESLGFDIVSMFFRDAEGNCIQSPVSGEMASLCIQYKAYKDKEINEVYVSFVISELNGESDIILRISSFDDGQALGIVTGENQLRFSELQVQMPYLCLKPGSYSIKLFVKKDSLYTLDFVEYFKFTVVANGSMSKCLFYQPRIWKSTDKVAENMMAKTE